MSVRLCDIDAGPHCGRHGSLEQVHLSGAGLNRRIYYRTMYDSTIRCFDLKATDFVKVKYASHPLDAVKRQPVRFVKVQTD